MVKRNSMEAAILNIEKSLGHKGETRINKLGDMDLLNADVEVIPFGIKEIDEASGCGGVPKGKLVEIFGPESGGKSYLSLRLIASAQRQGIKCCLVDAEQALDAKWAAKHGVDVQELYVINAAMSAEDTLDYVYELCKSGAFGLVVIDSTAALIPQKECDGSIGDQDYALLARVMSKACKKVTQACGTTKCSCIFINQIREKMGVMFGDPTTTPGGRSLKFYSSQRIKVAPGAIRRIKEGEDDVPVGRKSYVTFVKNKVGTPYGKCEIEIVFQAAMLHPTVMFCSLAKNNKLISIRNGEFYVKKSITNTPKNLNTETSTMVDLADYLVRSNLVLDILEALTELIDEEEIGEEIMEFISNPDSITSPLTREESEIKESESKNDKVSDPINEDG